MKCDMCGETITNDNYAILSYYEENNTRLYLCCECRKAVVNVVNEHYDRYVQLWNDDGVRHE